MDSPVAAGLQPSLSGLVVGCVSPLPDRRTDSQGTQDRRPQTVEKGSKGEGAGEGPAHHSPPTPSPSRCFSRCQPGGLLEEAGPPCTLRPHQRCGLDPPRPAVATQGLQDGSLTSRRPVAPPPVRTLCAGLPHHPQPRRSSRGSPSLCPASPAPLLARRQSAAPENVNCLAQRVCGTYRPARSAQSRRRADSVRQGGTPSRPSAAPSRPGHRRRACRAATGASRAATPPGAGATRDSQRRGAEAGR